jgi:hypothetical protein
MGGWGGGVQLTKSECLANACLVCCSHDREVLGGPFKKRKDEKESKEGKDEKDVREKEGLVKNKKRKCVLSLSYHAMQSSRVEGCVEPSLCYRRLYRVEGFSLFRFPACDCP